MNVGYVSDQSSILATYLNLLLNPDALSSLDFGQGLLVVWQGSFQRWLTSFLSLLAIPLAMRMSVGQ